jgi:hypothetical protein
VNPVHSDMKAHSAAVFGQMKEAEHNTAEVEVVDRCCCYRLAETDIHPDEVVLDCNKKKGQAVCSAEKKLVVLEDHYYYCYYSDENKESDDAVDSVVLIL